MLLKTLPFLLIASTACAEPVRLGPGAGPAKIFGRAVSPSVDARVEIESSVSTAKGSAAVNATIPRADLAKVIASAIRAQVQGFNAGPCSFHLKGVEDLNLRVSASTALINANIALDPTCALTPENVEIHLAIAPRIISGGIATLNVGDVKVKLPGAWMFADNLAADYMRDAVTSGLKKAQFVLPKSPYGKFALRSVKLEETDSDSIRVSVSLDSLHTRDQLNTLLASQLNGFDLSYP